MWVGMPSTKYFPRIARSGAQWACKHCITSRPDRACGSDHVACATGVPAAQPATAPSEHPGTTMDAAGSTHSEVASCRLAALVANFKSSTLSNFLVHVAQAPRANVAQPLLKQGSPPSKKPRLDSHALNLTPTAASLPLQIGLIRVPHGHAGALFVHHNIMPAVSL